MMKKRRFLSLLLCFIMVFSSTLTAFASEVTTENIETEAVVEATSETEVEVASENETQIDASVWTPADFVYESYEKLLYGCDYTRQFTVSGNAIAGFSESGEAKLALNTDLVIPATDTEGTPIVGVAQSAFKNKGLTSVTFPEGMLVDYDDTVTNLITKRGNFVIAENAFSGNKLTSVVLPEGVIAVLPHAFNGNLIESVKLPRTIWWIETMAFADNRITTVDFPTICDFRLEMHGLAFAKNFIQSVRIPDYTEVINKDVFFLNKGKEAIPADAKDSYKTYEVDGVTYEAGVVYMYTDNAGLLSKDRIHHVEKETASQHSFVQRLIVNDGSEGTQNPDQAWKAEDFTFEGTVVTGLSESGIAKRALNKDLVIPEVNAEGQTVTAIGDATAGGFGLFATETEKFDSVYIPSGVKTIGNFAFQNNGLDTVTFPAQLETIGNVAFQTNDLTTVILPDTVTSLGSGAFATNPKLEKISLSKALTVIPASAFGCSDGDNYMTNLTSIELHEGITEIGSRAFAGNNFSNIVLPSTVKKVDSYAFSTKNYLTTSCTVTLNEGLETIGNRAFRNKVITEITLPSTVTKLQKQTFEKEYSDATQAVVTKVYVSSEAQYTDTKNFPKSDYHKLYLTDPYVWTPDDFTYGEETYELYPASEMSKKISVTAWVITGFSEVGAVKAETNKDLVIPATDPNGRTVQGVGKNAFNKKYLTSVKFPENVKTAWDGTTWNDGSELTERGDFYIGYGAFRYNSFKTLELPEGIIRIDTYGFANNTELVSVKLPKSLMWIGQGGFYKGAITSVEFPEVTDFKFQMDAQAFSGNKIKAVQLPANTEKLDKYVFIQNTGMEEIKSGTSAEKKGGLVYMYTTASKAGSYVQYKSAGSSNVQELFLNSTMPVELAPWTGTDFTYDEAGTTITGLSDNGKIKIKSNPDLILPNVGPTGEVITALGDGVNNQGIFVYIEDGKYYTPASVELPKTLTKIGKWTFALGADTYEAVMTTIDLPEGLTEIGQTAFQNSKLTSVVLPDSVTTLGMAAYTGSNDITSIKLSANLTDIPANAFANVGTGLTAVDTVVIPEGVTSIGASAFAGRHIANLTLPNTLQTIGKKAFENHQLTSLVIPASVTKIEDQAFRVYQEGIKQTLADLTLNEGLVTIGKEAFLGSLITELNLPSTVVLSAKNKAADCIFGKSGSPADPIVTLYVSDASKVDEWNTSYANNYSHVVVYNKLVGTGWTAADFTYDEETATITGWSESGQAKRTVLTTLVLPDSTPEGKDIVAIGDEAFMIPNDEVVVTKFGIDSPNGMKSVVLPANVKTIGKLAFAQNALTLFESGEIETIGERAFYGNDLARVILNDTLTSLGEGAFATNDIVELQLSAGVTAIPQGCFSMNIRMENVIIPDTVTEIGDTAFAGARLTKLTIPESVTKIGRKAFHLHHLSELVIPGNVKEIGESAFEGTFKATTLTKLVIEEGVETIGKYAFKEALLETVHFPESIKTVGEKPFLNNKGKDGSNVVEVTTTNADHLAFGDDTFVVVYLGSWVQDNTGWWFRNADGTYPSSSWVCITDNWYYFNASGYRVENAWQGDYYLGDDGVMVTSTWVGDKYVDETGKKIINDWVDGFYLGTDGAKATCWIVMDGVDYYVKDGVILKNAWVGDYYVGEDGTIVTNAWVDGYYVGVTGKYLTGWLELTEGWYYLGTTGKVQTGWLSVNGVWYFADATGLLFEDTWFEEDGTTYFLNADGAMVTGWYFIDEAYFYFNASGAMVTNAWVGSYYLGEDGVMATNAWVDGEKSYVDENGQYVTGWLKLDGMWYYLGTNGVKALGWQYIGGTWYFFDESENGVMCADGLYVIDEKVYAFNASGAMLTGWQVIEEEWFFFDASGAGHTGWIQSGANWYYTVDGFMIYDGIFFLEAENSWAEFDASGVWVGYVEVELVV